MLGDLVNFYILIIIYLINRRGLSVWNFFFVEGGIKEFIGFFNRLVFDVFFDSLIDIKWDYLIAFCFYLLK